MDAQTEEEMAGLSSTESPAFPTNMYSTRYQDHFIRIRRAGDIYTTQPTIQKEATSDVLILIYSLLIIFVVMYSFWCFKDKSLFCFKKQKRSKSNEDLTNENGVERNSRENTDTSQLSQFKPTTSKSSVPIQKIPSYGESDVTNRLVPGNVPAKAEDDVAKRICSAVASSGLQKSHSVRSAIPIDAPKAKPRFDYAQTVKEKRLLKRQTSGVNALSIEERAARFQRQFEGRRGSNENSKKVNKATSFRK